MFFMTFKGYKRLKCCLQNDTNVFVSEYNDTLSQNCNIQEFAYGIWLKIDLKCQFSKENWLKLHNPTEDSVKVLQFYGLKNS